MDARKGETFSPSEPLAPIIRSTRNKYKDEHEITARRKGGDDFPQNTKFAHVASLIDKLSIKVPQKGGKPLLSQPASRTMIR